MRRGGERGRRLALAAVFVLPSALLCAAAAAVVTHYRIEPPPGLSPAGRAAAMAVMRAVMDGRPPARPRHDELERALEAGGPVVVTVWHEGDLVVRVEGRGAREADALEAAARALAESPELERMDEEKRPGARIKIDIVTARGPLLRGITTLELFALQAGVEGLGAVTAGPEEHLLLPQDLILSRLLVSQQPIGALPDLKVGINMKRADAVLARLSKLSPAAWDALGRSYFRFTTDAFVDQADGAPLPIRRGVPPEPELSAENLRQAAIEGGHYLVRHLADNGRYVYEVDLTTGRGSDPKKPRPYSLPRHAGVTYFLAELYRTTGESFLLEPIERAFGHFAELVAAGGCRGKTPAGAGFACVQQPEDQQAALGSTALAVVALCEYKRATRSTRFDSLTHELAEWLLFMQHEDGSFAHLYDARAGRRDDRTQMLYFSGEAALALVRMYTAFGEPRYIRAAERALDWLVGWYDFFGGGFFYGEEHWTCIAAEAAWPTLRHDRYREFCDGYSDFLRRQQLQAEDFPDQADLAGTYGVTPFIVPNNTPVGSRSEAMISTYLLGQHHGEPSEPLRQQILRSMRYALRQQVRPASEYWVAASAQGRGAIASSTIDPTVRIDYVQHVSSAMLRSAPLVAGPAGAGLPAGK